jgi:hypothetical protein
VPVCGNLSGPGTGIGIYYARTTWRSIFLCHWITPWRVNLFARSRFRPATAKSSSSQNPHRPWAGFFMRTTANNYASHFRSRKWLKTKNRRHWRAHIWAEPNNQLAADDGSQYPGDPRNARAAESLAKLATDANELTD